MSREMPYPTCESRSCIVVQAGGKDRVALLSHLLPEAAIVVMNE